LVHVLFFFLYSFNLKKRRIVIKKLRKIVLFELRCRNKIKKYKKKREKRKKKKMNRKSRKTEEAYSSSKGKGNVSNMLSTIAYYGFACILISIVIAILVIVSILESQSCPDCDCTNTTASPYNPGLNTDDIFFLEKTSVSETVEALTRGIPDMIKCSNFCFDRYYECPLATDFDNCKRKTMILRDCPNFHKCISECSDMCGFGSKSSMNYASNLCIGEYNENMICPKDSNK